MSQILRPGPVRTSCLTCRRRHKKCDQRQPTCERCEKGDFECLGYRHIQDDLPVANVSRPSRRILPKPAENEGLSIQKGLSELQGAGWSSNGTGAQVRDTVSVPSPSDSSSNSGLTTSDQSDPADIATTILTRSSSLDLASFYYRFQDSPSSVTSGPTMSVLRRIFDLYTRLPHPNPDLSKILNSQWFVETIAARLEKLMDYWYFRPPGYREQFHQNAVRRLCSSKFARWIALASMGVLDSFLTGDTSQNQLHNNWIGYIEGSLKSELALDLTPRQIRDRRSAWVHVSLMKARLLHGSSTYELLRSVTPAFLQVVYSNPTLWSNGCDLTRIPLMNILASESHELAVFALIDCTYAMAYGLPQRVEYDTTIHSGQTTFPSHQWVHCSPTEFQLVLADINACRDKSPFARDWRDIEKWLLAWQSRAGENVFAESWMTIAWYAVQESWRLALLVYLYLTTCNASSDDPRIQSLIKQILQVVGTVKKRGPSNVVTSFFLQYLMVGICARSEVHRQIVRDKLTSTTETRLWLMRGADFAPVLDHLWHGAAAGGRAVKWSDYIHSRETALPIGPDAVCM